MQRVADGPAAEGVAEWALAEKRIERRRQLLCDATKGGVLLEALEEHGGGSPVSALWWHGSSWMVLPSRYPSQVDSKRPDARSLPDGTMAAGLTDW
jgi:hypothetical protein